MAPWSRSFVAKVVAMGAATVLLCAGCSHSKHVEGVVYGLGHSASPICVGKVVNDPHGHCGPVVAVPGVQEVSLTNGELVEGTWKNGEFYDLHH
jgi:hypothetical protein